MKGDEPHLKVYADRSILVRESGDQMTFREGRPEYATRQRLGRIQQQFAGGYLTNRIAECRAGMKCEVPEAAHHLISRLVDSITEDFGRGLMGLTILQLCIKDMEPGQNIRLHKSGAGAGFSWVEGLPMRSLDSKYITPVLREEGLLSVNNYGVMMTRTLAENYPYTPFYKAEIRGARDEWLSLLDFVESQPEAARSCLQLILCRLINKSQTLVRAADAAITACRGIRIRTLADTLEVVKQHMANCDYPARLLEIAMHSLFQSLEDAGCLGDSSLVPLSQMRSANKKHGNIGDVELREGRSLVEAWDAKFGKPYLRDELEELSEKVPGHDAVRRVGFVTDGETQRHDEIEHRRSELEAVLGVRIELWELGAWARNEVQLRAPDLAEDALAQAWLLAYAETLGQRRRDRAPVDEPTERWLVSLRECAEGRP